MKRKYAVYIKRWREKIETTVFDSIDKAIEFAKANKSNDFKKTNVSQYDLDENNKLIMDSYKFVNPDLSVVLPTEEVCLW